MDDYDWTPAGGMPLVTVEAFSTLTSRSIYSDVCKAEQLMADTLQERRLVALVDRHQGSDGDFYDVVVDYLVLMPNTNSPHRVR